MTSISPVLRLGAMVAVGLFLGGCGSIEPWVKPYERERLGDPIMKIGPAPSLSAKHYEHVREVREGSRGGNGVQGGGCGCK